MNNCFVGKKILILGANPETAGLVIKANEMGIKTIVTDYQEGAFAKKYAWKAYDVDAMDISALIKLAKEENVDGILLGVAEAIMPVYYQLCFDLGFPCYGTLEQFQLMSDKAKFKQVCRNNDVPVVEEFSIDDIETTNDFISSKLPVIIKPVDSCSSKGITVCNTISDFRKGIEYAKSFSRSKKILIEKYMSGDEVILYYTIRNGIISLTAMCDRYTKRQENAVQLPEAYIYPSRHLKIFLESKVDFKIKSMLHHLDIKNGTMFLQSFFDGETVRIYEPGYRLNGAQEHFLVSANGGPDVKEMMIKFAISGQFGDDIDIAKCNPRFKKWGCKLSPLIRCGRITKLAGLDDIRLIPGIVSVNPSYSEGDTVTGFGTLKQIVSRFFIVTDTMNEMRSIIDTIYSKLVVLDERGESMLLSPFDTSLLCDIYPKIPL